MKLYTFVVHYLQICLKEYGCCQKFKRGNNSTYTFTKKGGHVPCKRNSFRQYVFFFLFYNSWILQYHISFKWYLKITGSYISKLYSDWLYIPHNCAYCELNVRRTKYDIEVFKNHKKERKIHTDETSFKWYPVIIPSANKVWRGM
jgi:hypothetical protein